MSDKLHASIHRHMAHGAEGGCSPPKIFQLAIFGQKNQVIFGQNHLIFMQAMEKRFGQETSAPLNETRPVRLCFYKSAFLKPCWQEQ